MEKCAIGSGDRRVKLPAGEDACSRVTGGLLDGFGRAFNSFPAQAGVDCPEQLFVDGVSVSGRRTTSSTGLEDRWLVGSNLRIDSISSPKNSMRTGRSDSGIDVEEAAASGILPGHLDHIGWGVADGVEVLKKFFKVESLSAAKDAGEIGIVVGRAKKDRGRLTGAMTMEARPVAIFQSAVARSS